MRCNRVHGIAVHAQRLRRFEDVHVDTGIGTKGCGQGSARNLIDNRLTLLPDEFPDGGDMDW